MATIKAWTIRPGRSRTLRWGLQVEAHEGRTWDRFLRLTTWGCCGEPTTFAYFALATGRRLFVSHTDLLEVRGAEGTGSAGVRYIGFGFTEEGKARLQYGPDTGVPKAFEIVSTWDRQALSLPKVFVEHEGQRRYDLNLIGQPYSFTVVLVYPDGAEVKIPIEDDRFAPENAALPPGFALRQIP